MGVSDITDLITNTAGGALGIGFYHILQALLKEKTPAVLNAVALILTVAMVALFVMAFKFMIR